MPFGIKHTKNIYPTDAKTTVGVEVLARTRLSFAHCDVRDRFSTGNRCF